MRCVDEEETQKSLEVSNPMIEEDPDVQDN